MNVQAVIEQKLKDGFKPSYLEVVNESSNHNVPAGSESHFKVVVVSEEFNNKALIARHRVVNQVLNAELQNQIHALAIHTYTEQEWLAKQGQSPDSPLCHGGSKVK